MIFLFFPLFAWALGGAYQQDCQQGHQRALLFSGNKVVFVETRFIDKFCTNPSIIIRSYGTYQVEPLPSHNDLVDAMDFQFSKVTLTPVLAEVAELYKQQRVCGLNQWQAGAELEITARLCDFFGNGSLFRVPYVGEKRYGIFLDASKEVYVGALSPARDATTPDRRPLTLDKRPYRLMP